MAIGQIKLKNSIFFYFHSQKFTVYIGIFKTEEFFNNKTSFTILIQDFSILPLNFLIFYFSKCSLKDAALKCFVLKLC